MAPDEVVDIIDILLRYLPREEIVMLIADLRPVTIDKEYQHILSRLDAELAGR